MNTYSLESFINFCDEMQITEEGLFKKKFVANNPLGNYIKSAVKKKNVMGVTILFQNAEDYNTAVSSYKTMIDESDIKSVSKSLIENNFADFENKKNYQYYLITFASDGPDQFYVTFDTKFEGKKRTVSVEIKNPFSNDISWKSHMFLDAK